jgi:hypothetical protein
MQGQPTVQVEIRVILNHISIVVDEDRYRKYIKTAKKECWHALSSRLSSFSYAWNHVLHSRVCEFLRKNSAENFCPKHRQQNRR